MMTCPYCGNAKQDLIEDNGCSPSDPELECMCIALIDEYGEGEPHPCYHRWQPNELFDAEENL